jgi:hypothetical protein
MRRLFVTVVATSSALLLAAGVAGAASQTVAGDKYGGKVGDVKKIVVNNGQRAVSTKVFGLGKPCRGAKFISVKVQNKRGKTLYTGEAGCYPGDPDLIWGTGLFDKGGSEVKCGKFDISRIKSNGAYKVFMPRSCLSNAPNRIRVEVSAQNWGSVTGGHAGPTKLLGRG